MLLVAEAVFTELRIRHVKKRKENHSGGAQALSDPQHAERAGDFFLGGLSKDEKELRRFVVYRIALLLVHDVVALLFFAVVAEWTENCFVFPCFSLLQPLFPF